MGRKQRSEASRDSFRRRTNGGTETKWHTVRGAAWPRTVREVRDRMRDRCSTKVSLKQGDSWTPSMVVQCCLHSFLTFRNKFPSFSESGDLKRATITRPCCCFSRAKVGRSKVGSAAFYLFVIASIIEELPLLRTLSERFRV